MKVSFSIRFSLLLSLFVCALSISAQDTLVFYNFDSGNNSIFTTGATGLNGGTNGRSSWKTGVPMGGLGYNILTKKYEGNADPKADHTTGNTLNYVAGQGLSPSNKKEGISGHYNNSSEWFRIPVLNCTDYVNVKLSFWQWANFEPGFDFAFVEISTDGINWTKVYQPAELQQASWNLVTLDISQYANDKPTVYIRWRTESDASVFYSGWNIDDVAITGTYSTSDIDSKLRIGTLPIPSKIVSTTDTYAERINYAELIIEDAGSGDKLPTLIDTLIITKSTYNSIANWRKTLAGVSLYDQATHTELIGTIETDRFYFTNRQFLSIADGSSKRYILKLYLKTDLSSITDNDRLGLNISYSGFSVNPAGSLLNSGAFNSVSYAPVIDITASRLVFVTEPEAILETNRIASPIIEVAVVDENGNRDLDFTGEITLSNSAGLSMANNIVRATGGISKFSIFYFSQAGGPAKIIANSTNPALTAAETITNITVLNSVAVNIFADNFDNSGITGWTSGTITGSNSWSKGLPRGGRGYSSLTRSYVGNPDPTSDHTPNNTINYVYGQGLLASSKTPGRSGYNNNSNEWLRSPAINCSNYYNTQLSFWRWANAEPDYDEAYLEISNDGTNWTQLDHPLYPQDNSWTQVIVNISEYADRQATIYIRWRLESDASVYYAGWNIDDVTITGIYAPATAWTGTVSSDWSNNKNWSGNKVPDAFSVVIINASTPNAPVISTSALAKQINIRPGATLQIETNASLEVFGNLVVETNATTYGAVIDKGTMLVRGKGIMSKFIRAKEWTYISSPVAGLKASTFGNKVYNYNEPLAKDDWSKGWELLASQNLEAGKGYNVYHPAGGEIKLVGVFNTGQVNVPVTYTDGAEVSDHEGWNLVGNPYPSAIDWDAASGWTKSNVNNAYYIWDEASQNFKAYAGGVGVNGGTNHIAPMQGFFVKATAPGPGVLGMNNNVRITASSPTFKAAPSFKNELKIKIEGIQYADETVVRFKTDATNDFDTEYDAEKRFSLNSEVPQIYTFGNENMPLVINSLKETDEYEVIDINNTALTEGNYTLSFAGINTFNVSKTVYLEDLVLDTLIDLAVNSTYNFYTSVTTDSVRFRLHIGMPLSVKHTVNHVSTGAKNNGSIELTILGGVQPLLSVEWSNGIQTEDIYGLEAGKYTVTITDYNLNTYTETIEILQMADNGELVSALDENEVFSTQVVGTESKLHVFNSTNNLVVEEIKIYDLSGKLVTQIKERHTGNFSIDVCLHQGIFIVNLSGEGRETVQKILVQ